MAQREIKPPSQLPEQERKYAFKDYFFSYSWKELQSLRHLRDAWVFHYAVCGLLGLLINPLGNRAESAFLLAAIACYPGYRVGLLLQKNENPQALESEHLMAWRLGNVAKLLSAIGIALLINQLL